MDQIELTDTTMTGTDVARILTASGRWLNLPIRNGAPLRQITVDVDGKTVRRIEVPLADEQPEWWSSLEVGDWKGKPLTLTVDRLPDNSRGLESVTASDAIAGQETLYKESLRPQFHFSAQRGWLNDPNGLSYYNGEYHLFFQHAPFVWSGGGEYWGHAVSRDLVHWTEVGEALYPDAFGAMWSGSAVVDHRNASGLGKEGKAPLVLFNTGAREPFVQCMAYSTDGRHFTKFAGNPIIPNITNGNRDPKVIWHEPTQHWVLALYVEKERKHTIHFFTSPNLKDWTLSGITEGQPGTNFLYECPDIFELPVDGDAQQKKWVLTAANSWYAVGNFDGSKFVPETPPLLGHRGRGFYAAQTFSDVPGDRRIQIGWWQTETPNMPFNQSMSLPMELHLVSTADGPRLIWTPVKELESLRAKTHTLGAQAIAPAGENPLASVRGELLEIRAEFTPGDAEEVSFQVRGVSVVYDAKTQELQVNGHAAPAPLRGGKQRLAIFVDRTGLEVFASDGLTFVPMPINLKPDEKGLSVTTQGALVEFSRLDVYELHSAWK